MDNVAKTVSRLRENLVANAYGVEVGVKDASRQKKRETFSAQVCAGRSMSREEFGHLEDLVSAASLEHENSYLAG